MRKPKLRVLNILLIGFLFCISVANAQTQTGSGQSEFRIETLLAQARPSQKQPFSLMRAYGSAFSAVTPAAATTPVVGFGTPGRLTRWTGSNPTSSFIGDSKIFESKFGLIGIGTDTPTSTLTVAGMIETTLGGYKFPDGTVQTTAAAPNALSAVIHDATLAGDGTSGSPLKVAVPLNLVGPAAEVLRIENTSGGKGLTVLGGTGGPTGESGIVAKGGNATDQGGGDAVVATGGFGILSAGGAGLRATGGGGGSTRTGPGVVARGGSSQASIGGDGLVAQGGNGDGPSDRSGDGIYARPGFTSNGAKEGLAGFFEGAVEVSGDFNVTGGGTKNFKIDHPLDPENKYLYHAAIESSEVLNIYSGNIKLDGGGEATVKLPEWFEALNKDFRYSLTPIGAPGAGLYIAQEVSDNQFRIAGGLPGTRVSWQVTGIRSDAAIRHRPFRLEEDKGSERGYYLTPEAYGQPAGKNLMRARNPETMKQLEQPRLESARSRNPN